MTSLFLCWLCTTKYYDHIAFAKMGEGNLCLAYFIRFDSNDGLITCYSERWFMYRSRGRSHAVYDGHDGRYDGGRIMRQFQKRG